MADLPESVARLPASCQSSEQSGNYDWQVVYQVLRSHVVQIVQQIQVKDFMDSIVDERECYAVVSTQIKGIRPHIDMLRALIQYIIENRDEFLLRKLVEHEDLVALNLALNHISGRPTTTTWSQSSKKTLENSLASSEVDEIADHLYSKRHIGQMTRDSITEEHRRIPKVRKLVSNVTTREAYACLLDVIARIFDRSDLCARLSNMDFAKSPEGEETDIKHVKQKALNRTYTAKDHKDDFIARYVLRECSSKLLSELHPTQVDRIADSLYTNEVLDAEMRDDIHMHQDKKKIRCLLDKLQYLGWTAYSQFKLLLIETGSDHLVHILEKVDKQLKGKSDDELLQIMAQGAAEVRGYLEMFDGIKWMRFNIKKSDTREKVRERVNDCLRRLDVALSDVEEGSLILSLSCGSLEGLVKLYRAYHSGELAARFASKTQKARIIIDKHTLISAFRILVNKEWPKESIATKNESVLQSRLSFYGDNSYYDMTHKHRGLLVLINNWEFHTKTKKQPRYGSDIDAENLDKVFTKLGFRVQRHDNLSASDMNAFMQEVEEFNHTKADCFACAILTHGARNDRIYGTDTIIDIAKLVGHVESNRCVTLRGKPKMFFIQACGDMSGLATDRMETVTVPLPSLPPSRADGSSPHKPLVAEGPMQPAQVEQKVNLEDDMLIVHSATPGSLTWPKERGTNEIGSIFMDALCTVLEKYGPTHEILQMITLVNTAVTTDLQSATTDEDKSGLKQTPSVMYRLTKQLYFPPKELMADVSKDLPSVEGSIEKSK